MARLPRDLSVADLERILKRRRAELRSLALERDQLLRQLAALDNRIRGIAGRSATAAAANSRIVDSGRARRPRNAMNLVDTLVQVMGKSGQPMAVGDIVQAAVDAGYRSTAANFRGLVNVTLIKERKRFANAGRGIYQLKN